MQSVASVLDAALIDLDDRGGMSRFGSGNDANRLFW